MAYALQNFDTQIKELASKLHCSKKEVMRRAIQQFADDYQDAEIAHTRRQERLRTNGPLYDLTTAMKDFDPDAMDSDI